MMRHMKNTTQHIYIGVAWPYVNDIFHLGNLAGAYLPPDIFARFHRLSGNTVLMVSGSDMHGTPTTVRALKEGVTPQEIAKRYHGLDKRYLEAFHISYDLYTSTATENHRRVTQEMFLKLLKNGFIKILTTKQPYSDQSKAFLQDRYIEGECPHCHFSQARGDQCEQCGRSLDPIDLINPRSKIDKSPLVFKDTQNYFLDLSLLQDDIRHWLENKKDWRTWVKAEALGWTKEGLKPRAITRDMDYGVPLPVSEIPSALQIEHIEHKVFYVWFEAVIGYLSAAVEYSSLINDSDYWKAFFYAKEAKTYYFVGQDNLVFHTINWPAQLLGYDKDINLPANVFVNKFLLLEGEKMSKSRGWFIETPYLLEHYDADAVRFYIACNMPQAKEFDFTWQGLSDTTNNVLIGTVANFVHRVLTFYAKHFGSEVSFKDFSCDSDVASAVKETFTKSEALLAKGEFKEALQAIVNLAVLGNQFAENHRFWEFIRSDKAKVKETLLNLIVIIYHLSILLFPFVPFAAKRLSSLLSASEVLEPHIGKNAWRFSPPQMLILSSVIQPLFEKIDEAQIKEERQRLHQQVKRD